MSDISHSTNSAAALLSSEGLGFLLFLLGGDLRVFRFLIGPGGAWRGVSRKAAAVLCTLGTASCTLSSFFIVSSHLLIINAHRLFSQNPQSTIQQKHHKYAW